MAKTMQGAFDTYYHHIDAPTVQDDEWSKEHKSRKLIVPKDEYCDVESSVVYRDPLATQLKDCLWVFKRKLDGENMRVLWDGEQALWNGKSDKFVCGAELTNYMNETFLEEIFEEKFGRDKKVALYGEHMGKKVQGNELNLEAHQFILFDVNIDGIWLNMWQIQGIAKYFGINTCYDFMSSDGEYYGTLDELIKKVSEGEFRDWEGIVATPAVECRNQKGERVIVKIKNRDYLREE